MTRVCFDRVGSLVGARVEALQVGTWPMGPWWAHAGPNKEAAATSWTIKHQLECSCSPGISPSLNINGVQQLRHNELSSKEVCFCSTPPQAAALAAERRLNPSSASPVATGKEPWPKLGPFASTATSSEYDMTQHVC